jgi:hypothetical protein
MSEPKLNEKKMVTRSVAIALGMICIISVVLLVGAGVLMKDKDSKNSSQAFQISSLQHQNNQLQTQLNGNVSQNANLQTWLDGNKTEYNDYVATHHYTDTDYNLLQSIANLGEQQVILDQYTTNQGANTHSYVTGFQANYAGYLHISLTSTTTNAYVIVEYWFQGRLFSVTKSIGTSGEAYFPLMPSSIAIYVGNTNLLNGATETITATYYY